MYATIKSEFQESGHEYSKTLFRWVDWMLERLSLWYNFVLAAYDDHARHLLDMFGEEMGFVVQSFWRYAHVARQLQCAVRGKGITVLGEARMEWSVWECSRREGVKGSGRSARGNAHASGAM